MSLSKGLWAAAATGVQVGVAMVATRALVDAVGPVTLALLRYLVGLACLLPFFLAMRRAQVARRDLPVILSLGAAQFGLLVALLNVGLRGVTAAQGAVLFATFPLLTMLLAALLGRERLSCAVSTGVGLSVLGVALALGAGSLAGATLMGAGFVLMAALTGAICAVFYRPYLERYPTLQVGTLAMFAAVIGLAVFAPAEAPWPQLSALTGAQWVLIAFVGLSSGAGYLLWLTALRHAPATQATALLGLSPVTAAVFGVLALGEPLTWSLTAGIALVMAGLWMALRPLAIDVSRR